MAVETKIGLVVGLGFITCFAVVLSHRGSGDQLSARMAYDLLSKQRVNVTPKPQTPPETYTRRQARERQKVDTSSARRREASEPRPRDNRRRAKTNRASGAKHGAATGNGARRNSIGNASALRRRSSTHSSGDQTKKTTPSQGRRLSEGQSARHGRVNKRTARDGGLAKRTGLTKNRSRAERGVSGTGGERTAGKTSRQPKKGLPSFEELFGGASEERDEIETGVKRQAGLQTARRSTTRRGVTTPAKTKKRPANTGLTTRSRNRESTPPRKVASRGSDAPDVSKAPKKAAKRRDTTTVPSAKNVKTTAKPTPPARYVVKPRDTLWRISKRMYGVGSRRIVDAILAANKDRLTSAERLRVGVELVLPAIDGVGIAKLAGQRHAERRGKLASAVERPRYYQIQNGDRYSTIAERFLGDKSRWKEVYELNKDIFPDPGKIRYGVRIRLPSSARLASAS